VSANIILQIDFWKNNQPSFDYQQTTRRKLDPATRTTIGTTTGMEEEG